MKVDLRNIVYAICCIDCITLFQNSGEEGKFSRRLSRIGSRSQREPPRPPSQADKPQTAAPPRSAESAQKPPEAAPKPSEPAPKPLVIPSKPPVAQKPAAPPRPQIQVFNSGEHGAAMLNVRCCLK